MRNCGIGKRLHTPYLTLCGRFRGHRNAAYAWLAQKMGLPVEKTHIGMFDVGQCRKAIEIIEKETKGDRYGRYQKDPR